MSVERGYFLNVDLVLRHRSPAALKRLVADLRPDDTFVLHLEKGFAVLEVDCSVNDVDDGIGGFERAIKGLPRASRAIWNQCTERIFDIGIQAGRDPNPCETRLSRRSVERIRSLGGEIQITVYGSGISGKPYRPRAGNAK